MPKADIGALANRLSPAIGADPDVVPYAARVSVWGRWFIGLVSAFEIAYRPGFWYPDDWGFVLLLVALATLNGSVHFRLLTDRPVTWRLMLLLSAMDIALGHGQHRHRPRVRQLRLRGLLSGPRAVRRGLHLRLARSSLDDDDCRRLCLRMLDGERRSRCLTIVARPGAGRGGMEFMAVLEEEISAARHRKTSLQCRLKARVSPRRARSTSCGVYIADDGAGRIIAGRVELRWRRKSRRSPGLRADRPAVRTVK